MTKAITKNSKKGFTLVELVIVIAILAILAAIAIPVVNSIINTASKNAALSNADSIDLAIKECQAHIASRNGEVYPEALSATDRYKIDVAAVAEKKGIKEAFKMVTYNGEDYLPFWDIAEDKCVFLQDTTYIELGTGEKYINAPSNCVKLSVIVSGELRISTTEILKL